VGEGKATERSYAIAVLYLKFLHSQWVALEKKRRPRLITIIGSQFNLSAHFGHVPQLHY